MTNIITFEDRHQSAQWLLPWYITGRLDRDDFLEVEGHLRDCPTCRADAGGEQRLREAVATSSSAAEEGWKSFQARIDTKKSTLIAPPKPRRRTDRLKWRGTRWRLGDQLPLRWLAAAQFAALLVLSAAWLQGPQQKNAFRTLGDTTSSAQTGNTLAMFRPQASEAELRHLLTSARVRVVDGPTSAGAYVLAVPGGASGPALTALRSSRDVTMAEPIEQAPPE